MNKHVVALASALAAGAVWAEAAVEPQVSEVTMTQDASRQVTISYVLANGPAVVTVDIETNAHDDVWASIGGENIQRLAGDVNKVVSENGAHTITWRPDLSWPDHKVADNGARAVVTAWSLDNTPDYMVIDLAKVSGQRVAYYPNVGQIPGGILANTAYRTTLLPMRRIPAANVTFTMGSVSEVGREKDETTHPAKLDRDFYMAVFETTQGQWDCVVTSTNRAVAAGAVNPLYPMTYVSYNDVRNSSIDKYNADNNKEYGYPNGPHASSFLGRLNTLTGLADFGFDLPGEAQWEFACRAGNGEGYWNNGVLINRKDTNESHDDLPGNVYSSTMIPMVCGSFPPNSWGLYDMHGNAWEWCLDYYEADITDLNGAINANGEQTAHGKAAVASRVRRSSSFSTMLAWHRARSAHRIKFATQDDRREANGFRLICYGTLK